MFPVRMVLYIIKGLYYPKKVLAGKDVFVVEVQSTGNH
jgi:hypothetical protein